MAFPLINPFQQFFDSSGAPLVNGTIEFRDPTTNNLINSYPDADNADAQTNANDNPLTLDANGAAASGLYLEDGVKYRVVLKTSAGATVTTQDDVICPIDLYYSRQTADEATAGVTPSDYTYPPGDVRRYGAAGDGVTDDTTAIQNALDSNTVVTFPAGTFNITAALSVIGGQTLRGVSRTSGPLGGTAIETQAKTYNAIEIASNARFVIIERLRLQCADDTGTTNAGIDCTGASGVAESTFDQVNIVDFAYGINAADLFWQNTVRNCRFVFCTISVNLAGTDGSSINNIFEHCYFDQQSDHGMFISAYKGTTVDTCNFGGLNTTTTGAAIECLLNTFGLEIRNCNFEDFQVAADDAVIRIQSASTVTITSPDFVSNQGAAATAYYIRCQETSRTILSGAREVSAGADIDFLYITNTASIIILDDSFDDDSRINYPGGSSSGALVTRSSAGRALVSRSLDLSGAADDALVFIPEYTGRMTRASYCYTEATSADAGVNLSVETSSGSITYVTAAASATGQSQWAVAEQSLNQTVLQAGVPVIFKSAGSKTGTGEVACLIEYVMDQS